MSSVVVPFGEALDENQPNSRGTFSEKSIKKARTLVAFKHQRRPHSLPTVSVENELYANKEEHRLGNVNETAVIKSLPPRSCHPLLRFVHLADFQDDKKLQRNFEEILRIGKMGCPLKILKQDWFPGTICIPVFHCQRCLTLWMEAGQVPTLCGEVNRSIYGRMMPISITNYDLLTKLSKHVWNRTDGRTSEKRSPLSKPVPSTTEKSDNNAQTNELPGTQRNVHAKTVSKRAQKPIPIAEFVDIEEQFQKLREQLSGKTAIRHATVTARIDDEESPDDERKPMKSGLDEISSSSCLKNGDVSEQETDDMKDNLKVEGHALLPENEKMVDSQRIMDKDRGVDGKSSSCSSCIDDFESAEKHTTTSSLFDCTGRSSSCPRLSKAGYLARPPSRVSSVINKHLEVNLTVSGRQKVHRSGLNFRTEETEQIEGKQSLRQDPELKIDSNKLESVIPDGPNELPKNTKEEDEKSLRQLLLDTTSKRRKRWIRRPLSKRSVQFDMRMNDLKQQTIPLRPFKWDVTRAFRFSYFTLLRKADKYDVIL